MSKTWKIIVILAVIGLITAALVFKFVYNKPHKDYLKKNPDYSLSAEALFTTYVSDKVSADSKYTGKVLQIDGVIKNIEDLDSIVTAVFSFNEGMFGDEGVRCSFEPSVFEEARLLQTGQSVTIKGHCDGYNETDIILEHCSIIK